MHEATIELPDGEKINLKAETEEKLENKIEKFLQEEFPEE